MNALNEKALLVDLSISHWTARKYDKKISKEIAQSHGADGIADDVGRYNKILIAKSAISQVTRTVSRARADHTYYTMPWIDGSFRIVPARLFLDYTAKMGEHKAAFWSAVDTFEAAYPELMREAEKRLNGMFDANDYPHPAAIRERFAFEIDTMPVPNVADFRVSLSDDVAEELRREIEQRATQRYEQATRDVWERIRDAVKHIRDRMRDFDPDAGGKLHDSVIGNLRDLVSILPALNIADDPELENMRRELERSLCKKEIASLKGDARGREQTRKAADRLLGVLAAQAEGS